MKLSEYLTQRGESVASFAKRLGMSRQAIYLIIRGKSRPTLDTLGKIIGASEGLVTAADFGITDYFQDEKPRPDQAA